jgi:glycosyltransferase involved in cell wall biosynthesis
MDRQPRLSIGLPVYNSEAYLGASLESLLGQSYEDFELTISDNASTDGTSDICLRYSKTDSRIRYFRQMRNIGLAPNHNFVFRESRGELFKWAAADDLYGRDLLRYCVDALDENPDVVLAHTWQAVIDDRAHVTQALEYPLKTHSPSAPQRFRSLLFGGSGLFERDADADGTRELMRLDNYGILRACDEYGVVRADVMRQVKPLASYHHADRIVVCELLLRGPFYIVPEWMYFRREVPGRSYNRSPGVRDRCTILDPARANRLMHPAARLFAEYMLGYLRADSNAPLSRRERRECYGQIVSWAFYRISSKVVAKGLHELDSPISSLFDGGRFSFQAAVAGQQKEDAQ